MMQIFALILLIAIKQLKGYEHNFTQSIKQAEDCGGNINIYNTINLVESKKPKEVDNTNFCKIDYYWRDFDGKNIPEDAFIAGQEQTGRSLYVGQAYIRHKELLPATIYQTSETAVSSAYNELLRSKDYVKILCSPYSQRRNLKWRQINSADLNVLKANIKLIDGGSEVGQHLYVGRATQDGAHVIGKIFEHHLGNKGLWVPNKDGKEDNHFSYEVLTYNCNE